MSHDPLDSEERELARLLGRMREATPPAAVDAAILATARAATQTEADAARPSPPAPPAPRARRRPARWPAMSGIAASLVVAFGLAWHLQPPPAQPPPLHDATRSASAGAEPAAAPPAQRAMHVPIPAEDAAPAPTDDRAPPAPARAARSLRTPVAPSATAVMAAPAAHQAPAPASAAYPAPASPLPDSAHPADFLQQLEADQRLPRRQWLSQIRRHREAGNLELARCSLTHFLLRHPGTRLPDDLRELMEQ